MSEFNSIIVMVIDIVLRVITLMSLSSPVISAVMEPALYQFLIALIAICHRCVWNFFRYYLFINSKEVYIVINRVENEHLHNLKGYHVVLHLRLPYKNDKFEDTSDEVFSKIIENPPKLFTRSNGMKI